MTTSHPAVSMQRARRNVLVLIAAQALLGSQMSMIFIVGGRIGGMLSPNPCWATLPLSMLVLGSMLSAQPLSWFMQQRGRRLGFQLSVLIGALGGVLALAGLFQGSFLLYLLGSLLTGVYMSAQGFYRFAATDTAPEAYAPRAISLVMAGGLFSALLGPYLVRATDDLTAVSFAGTYGAIIVLDVIGLVLFLLLDIPHTPPKAHNSPTGGRSRGELLRDPNIVVAMICAMVAYALMNLVMVSTPIAAIACGVSADMTSNIISAHVLAMFLPSFFTGHLIARFGAPVIVGLGLAILAGAGAVALTGVEVSTFFAALILLGLGWNFGFIGATAMLTAAHSPEERGRVQGINDFVVFGGVFLASLSSGGLMNCSGAVDPRAGWNAVNLAMVPFLVLAGGALIWLTLRPKPVARG